MSNKREKSYFTKKRKTELLKANENLKEFDIDWIKIEGDNLKKWFQYVLFSWFNWNFTNVNFKKNGEVNFSKKSNI